jgi:hypothetical protein
MLLQALHKKSLKSWQHLHVLAAHANRNRQPDRLARLELPHVDSRPWDSRRQSLLQRMDQLLRVMFVFDLNNDCVVGLL